MKVRLDNILLCILWLLAVTLATSFWFNTAFGFNIFSGEHWEYISSLQASHAPIKTGFYISMAIAVFITIFGFYIIIRPKFRKIRLPVVHNQKQKNEGQNSATTAPDKDASTINILPAENQPAQTSTENRPYSPSASARPPRLVLPTLNAMQYNAPQTENPLRAPVAASQPTYEPQKQSNNSWPEIRQIFTDAGYTIKPNVKINGNQTSLIAIGTNETIWLGCVGIKTTDIREMIDKIQQVFLNTLDETEITINGFAIAAPDAATSEFEDILMFNSISELKEYMSVHPNPPVPDDDDGMFEAYSQYIDAVITHIGKI